jgi:RHS repeat-associated protein
LNQNGTTTFTASFTGKMYDAEAGMYYFNARWYDSEIGRFITQDPIRDGLNWWNYCNGNPLSFIDWNGLEQSAADKVIHNFAKNMYKTLKDNPQKLEEFKKNFRISIYRDKNDDKQNGQYYKSELCIEFLGIPMNSIAVQSTADNLEMIASNPKDNGTIPAKTYKGRLLKKSPRFLKPIKLEDSPYSGTLIHPNVFTGLKQKKKYNSKGEPRSAACQVVDITDYPEIINILESVGFCFNNKDSIDVVINSPENPSKYTDRTHKIKKPLKQETVLTSWKE